LKYFKNKKTGYIRLYRVYEIPFEINEEHYKLISTYQPPVIKDEYTKNNITSKLNNLNLYENPILSENDYVRLKEKIIGIARKHNVLTDNNTSYTEVKKNMTEEKIVKTEEIPQAKINKKYDELRNDGRIEFITFHPSYSYEEFIEGITIDVDSSGTPTKELKYKLKQGIFKLLAKRALADALNIDVKSDQQSSYNDLIVKYHNKIKELTSDLPREKHAETIEKWWKDKPKYCLIIDEINRGDISKIFGELITLIEADKRIGMENEILVKLPYSGDTFGVPPNIYIVATMNTADKSIALIDIALRRRFGFIEMGPDFDVLKTDHINKNKELFEEGVYDGLNKSVDALRQINEKICKDPSVGRDKQIGHSFLFKVKTQSDLIMVWQNEILPLLEEYYYGKYDKINSLLFKDGNKWINEIDGIRGFSENFGKLIKFLNDIVTNNEQSN